MNTRRLTITWKPDVLTFFQHEGSTHDYKGKTSRSERESFRNVKSELSAQKILSKRNKNEILFAEYLGDQFEPPVILVSNK